MVKASGTKLFFEGNCGSERVVREEQKNGIKFYYEGDRNSERIVREEIGTKKTFYEGARGLEKLVRMEIGTKKAFYKGARGLEMLVRIEKTEYYEGNAGCETLVGSLCCVCLNEEKDVLFAPCGHLCMCQLCHAKLPAAIENTCPLCNCPGVGIRVYF